MCRALFAYDALNDDELSLQKGDLIILLSRENQDAGWWKGELRGKIGMFPDNFVQEVPSNEVRKELITKLYSEDLLFLYKSKDLIWLFVFAVNKTSKTSGKSEQQYNQ